VVRVTANPGEGFLDRMISLVEGAKRQKTPNEIALNILLAAFTIVFLAVCMTLLPFSLYSVNVNHQGTPITITVLWRCWFVSSRPLSAGCCRLSVSPGWTVLSGVMLSLYRGEP
jgi:high-affinity K+ transport system ATPase subunit B